MVNKITTPPTQNEVIDKVNEIIDDKQDTISDLATIRSGATGNVKLNGGSSQQTISLTSGTGTTALGVKSMSVSSYISFSGSSGWLASFGIGSDKKPTIYDGSSHVIAYTSDIPTVNNPTITFTQGGTTKGTITLNQSSNQTIAFDAGGGGGSTFIPYGESDSAADATQKEVTISSITSLSAGQIIIVKPTKTSTVANSTLKLNDFTAYPMRYGAAAITTSTDSVVWSANYPSWFRFDGDYWVFLGHGVDNNTTYSTMSVSEGTTGTATSNRSLQARYLKQIIQGTTLTGISTSTTGAVTASDTVTTGIGKLQATKADKSAIPTVNNATLTIQKNGTNVATFTANASSNVTANISVPNVTSTYTATGTDAVNGVAVSNAIATKQDNLVSGTNIKTINGTSILGSGNITIETSSTPNVDGETISYNSSDALQTIAVKNKRDDSTLPIWHGTEQQWNRGVPTTWYYWQTSVTAMWTSGGVLPASPGGNDRPVYGSGSFVMPFSGTNIAAYSTDGGVTWNSATLPSSGSWNPCAYGNGVFIASKYGNSIAYSTDGGVTWSQSSTALTYGGWRTPAYGDGKFVTVTFSSTNAAYSTDGGVTWNSATLPSSGAWVTPAYGDGNFVTVASGSTSSAYSTDGGATWTAGVLPSSGEWVTPAYGDGNFVTIKASSRDAAYSTDGGATWNSATLPLYAGETPIYSEGKFILTSNRSSSSIMISSDGGATWEEQSKVLGRYNLWSLPAYGDGKFVTVGIDSSNSSAYSTDGGTTWNSVTLPSSGSWHIPTYGDGKFVTVATNSNATAIFTIQYDKCYTDKANPTTTSVVYSEPATQSALTISSVTSGAITLSNNNTYYYNQSGNAYTYQSVGVAHPEYLCFIDGVGVKIGTTTIATNS